MFILLNNNIFDNVISAEIRDPIFIMTRRIVGKKPRSQYQYLSDLRCRSIE